MVRCDRGRRGETDVTYETGDGGTLGRRDPEVGRSSVEDDLELLGWGSNSDRRIVLCVHVV